MVQKPGLAGDHADGQPAANDLPVCHDVGFHAEPRLRAARMNAEPRDHLVEDQRDAFFGREAAQFLQESLRLQIGIAALRRLHQHRREAVRVGRDGSQRFGRSVIQHHHVFHHARRRADAYRYDCAIFFGGQHTVEDAVIGVAEQDDFVPPRGRAGQPERHHDGLRAGVAEGDALHSGQFVNELGHLARQIALGAQFEPFLHLPRQRLVDKRGLVAEEMDPHPDGDIDVLVAVEIPEPRAVGTRGTRSGISLP